MTKVRDIAAFLGKTESLNTTNKTLAFDSSAVTTITPAVVSTLAGAGGTIVYDSVGLLPASPSDGDRAWVTSNNRFYVADSSWHNSLLINIPPTINIANYDSVLTDSQSLTMTIQVTDSFENPDIISFNAVLSPPNITDSAIATFSRDSSVIAIAMSPDSTNDATSFTITFSANDQVNLSTSVKSFTIDKGFVLEPLSQIISLSGSTIINADSDLAGGTFSLGSGDTLSDSASSIEATVASATFLDNTQQSRTSAGNTTGVDVGAGKVAIPTGTIDSSYIGWIWSGTSSETTTASYFRTGNSSGGQTIAHLSEQPATWAANSGANNLSAMRVHGAVGGSYYRSYSGVVCTQYTLTTNGGSTRKGTIPMYHSGNSFKTFSPYADGKKSGSDHFITMKVDGLTSGNQGANYNWPIPSWQSNWNYRNVTIRANNTSYFGGGTSMQTSFVLDGNQSSNFQAGGVLHIGENSGYNQPTNQEVYEGKFFTILAVCYFSNYGNASPFNMTTSYGGGTVSMWSGANNSLYFGVRANRYQTGIIISGNMGYNQNTMWGTTLQTSTYANGINQNIPMYTRNANLCNEVHIISPDYPLFNSNHNFVTSGYGTDLRPSYSEWSSTNNASGSANGAATYPIYTRSSDAYTQLELDPSPAGDGTEVDIGTSVVGSYVWKNGTKITVDDNTGFTAGKFLQKKT
jgi:hypothetical protein